MPETSVREALKKAIGLEKEGNTFYLKCANETINDEGKKMFLYLAHEEVKHANKIREILDEENTDKNLMVWVPDLKDIGGEIFKDDVPGGSADERADEISALNIGIEAEKSSIKLYRTLAEQAGDQEQAQIFVEIANEEEKHLAILEKEVEFVTETGNFYDFKTITT